MYDHTIRQLHIRAMCDFDTLLEETFGIFHQIEEGTEDDFVINQCEQLQSIIDKTRILLKIQSVNLAVDTVKEEMKEDIDDEGAE